MRLDRCDQDPVAVLFAQCDDRVSDKISGDIFLRALDDAGDDGAGDKAEISEAAGHLFWI